MSVIHDVVVLEVEFNQDVSKKIPLSGLERGMK